MNKNIFLIISVASSLFLSACSSDDDDISTVEEDGVITVDFGTPPPSSIIASGTVEIITEDATRYHVLVFGDRVTSTIVETQTGTIIVDVAFGLVPNSGAELRAYADAIEKPTSVIITHAHQDHYGNIGFFQDANVYAETKNAAELLADETFTGLFSGTVNGITGATQIAGIDLVFENISNTEAPENGYIYIPSDKTLFLGDLVFNQSHLFIRDYTPLDTVDELDLWIAGLNEIKTSFGDYNYVFIGHNGYRADVSTNLDENIAYLSDSQGLILGTKALENGEIASSVQDVIDELEFLYPNYKPGGLLLALPDTFFPGDPGAAWFP